LVPTPLRHLLEGHPLNWAPLSSSPLSPFLLHPLLESVPQRNPGFLFFCTSLQILPFPLPFCLCHYPRLPQKLARSSVCSWARYEGITAPQVPFPSLFPLKGTPRCPGATLPHSCEFVSTGPVNPCGLRYWRDANSLTPKKHSPGS